MAGPSLGNVREALDRGEFTRAFEEIRSALAESAWNVPLLASAGELLATLSTDSRITAEFSSERIALVGGCTTATLLPALRCALADEGVLADVYEGPFGAYRQEILDASSGLHSHDPETVLIVRSWRDLGELLPRPGDSPETIEQSLAAETAAFSGLWSILDERHGCRILQHDFELPDLRYVGPAERMHPASHMDFLAQLNARLRQAARGRVAWVEIEDLSRRVGAERFSPASLYHRAKLPFNPAHLASYARLFQGAWRASAHRSKKVLVTDLDGTLWGGVIGDDGLDGVALGPGSTAGEGFEAFGRYLVDLQQRGVVLAVCSKNDPAIAVRPFREHAHMQLREDSFAVFHCAWSDKASGLRNIAATLNLGLDSMVFVDDNPAECALIRRELPEVTTLHLGGEPSSFPAVIESRHLFDRPMLTQEDLERGRRYRSRARAEQLRTSTTDLDGYLRDLGMTARFALAAPADMDRLAQLESKTNQFNVTTARFSRADLDAFESSPEHDLFAFRLRDKFTDHGLVSSVVLHADRDLFRLLNWTLSCRVFSRGAEIFIRNRLLARCRARGLRGLAGVYRPTAKNGVIAELLPQLGFVEDGERGWFLAADSRDLACHIVDESEPSP